MLTVIALLIGFSGSRVGIVGPNLFWSLHRLLDVGHKGSIQKLGMVYLLFFPLCLGKNNRLALVVRCGDYWISLWRVHKKSEFSEKGSQCWTFGAFILL